MRLLFILFLASWLSACASLSQDKEAAALHMKIGTNYLMNGSYPEALTELLQAQELDPKEPSIQNNLGLVYFFRQRYDLAEKHVRRALELDPKYSDARNNLARILIERGQYPAALKETDIVLADLTYTSPEKPLINQGIAFFKMGQFSKARVSFAKAIEFQRDECLAHSYYGRTLYELKDYARARSALDRAVGFCMRSQFDEPHYYSALTLFQLGQRDKAITRFEEVIKLYPNGQYSEKAKEMLETIKR